jgi:hypothetical protein
MFAVIYDPWGWTLTPRREHPPLRSPLEVRTLFRRTEWRIEGLQPCIGSNFTRKNWPVSQANLAYHVSICPAHFSWALAVVTSSVSSHPTKSWCRHWIIKTVSSVLHMMLHTLPRLGVHRTILCSRYLGCQIFPGIKYQKQEKCTKLPQNIPNDHIIYQVAAQ